MKNYVSNTDIVKILLQEYLDRDDVCRVLNCCTSKASKVIVAIHNELTKKGIITVRGKVSSKAFIEFMNFDLNDFIQKAKIEQELKIS